MRRRGHPARRARRALQCLGLAAAGLALAASCGEILGVDDYGSHGSGSTGGLADGGPTDASATGVCTSVAAPTFEAPAAMTLTSGAGRGVRVAADGGQVFLAGEIIHGVDLAFGDGAALSSPDGDGVFLASLTPGEADAHRWSLALRPVGSGHANVMDETLVRAGRDQPVTGIAVVGSFTGTVAFSIGAVPTTSATAGSEDAFVALVDPDGTPRWLRSFGNAAGQRALGAAIDGSGHLVVAVYGEGSFDFAPGCPANTGPGSAVSLAAFDPADGACVWSTSLPTGILHQPLHPKPIDLAYSPADNALVLVGATRGSSWFGPSDGMDEVFVLHIGADHEPGQLTLIGGETAGFGERWAETVTADDCGGVFVGGGFRNDLALGSKLWSTGPDHRDDDAEADAFVCKVMPDGAVAWCHVFGGSGAQAIADLATDGAGVIAIAGALHLSGAVDLGGDPGGNDVVTPDASSRDAFVAALIDSGDHAVPALGRAFGDDDGSEQEANGCAVDTSGRITAAGTFFAALRHADPPGGALLGAGYTPYVLSFTPAP